MTTSAARPEPSLRDHELEGKVSTLLRDCSDIRHWHGVVLFPMVGQASARQYYRATPRQSSSGAGREAGREAGRGPVPGSVVIMHVPDGLDKAEEKTGDGEAPDLPPFVDVGRLLESTGFPVPHVYGFSRPLNMIAVADLGDIDFESMVRDAPGEVRRRWYRRAIQLLIRFQSAGKAFRGESIAFQRQFDFELLRWELEHFVEWGIAARLGKALSDDEGRVVGAAFDAIATELAEAPSVLVHRDYQSRNLMVDNDELWLIDFQDALRGPLAYDLVALLRDSYVVLSDEDVDDGIQYFAQERIRAGAEARSVDAVREQFDLITVQRKLKDAGRFVYIDRVKGNPDFLEYFEPSLRYVERALSRLPRFAGLRAVLASRFPEIFKA